MTATFKVIKHHTGDVVGVVQLDASQVMQYMGRNGEAVAAGEVLTDSQRRKLGLYADHVIKFWRV